MSFDEAKARMDRREHFNRHVFPFLLSGICAEDTLYDEDQLLAIRNMRRQTHYNNRTYLIRKVMYKNPMSYGTDNTTT